MYFVALATDYDGTLAHDGTVSASTLASLERLKDTGRKLILVTGRELPDLKRVFPQIGVFDKVVAENGALLYSPATEKEDVLAPPPPDFVNSLEAKGVDPISVGRSIVATWEPHQTTVLDTIKECGLELDIVFNKGAVMILPSGVNKASGLEAALAEMGLSAHNVVGVGDAENDHAFLRACGCSVAVANALAAVKDMADLVTKGSRGQGIEELVEALIEKDEDLGSAPRNGIVVGSDSDRQQLELRPTDCVLIAGSSGIGKSTLATALTERCTEKGFQFCVLDREGDYDDLDNTVTVGDGTTPPNRKQALNLLEKPETNLVLSTLAIEQDKRPEFFAELLPDIAGLRAKTARPHWLIADEAHHLIPKSRDGASLALSKPLPGTTLITVHPDAVSTDALRLITAVLALGPKADEVVKICCRHLEMPSPEELAAPEGEQVLFWRPGKLLRMIEAKRPHQSRKRHSRKYAQGELDEEASFYFRGPKGALNLRAQNLIIFLQIAAGVDDGTWEHHLRAGGLFEVVPQADQG